MSSDECEVECVHAEAVAAVREALPSPATLTGLADWFRVLGTETRVRLLCALSARELCVCDLSAVTGMSQSSVSQQLRVLRAARMVVYRREGKIAYYSLSDEHVRQVVAQVIDHLNE